jgi:phosphoglycerate dehydrogenase-like enzyme
MIRILITFPLTAKDLDLLNEIPEFEVNEKSGIEPQQMLDELLQADALVCGSTPPLSKEALAAGTELKLIVAIGAKTGVDAALARKQGIEVRPVAGGKSAAAKAIAILKDFFNV